MIILLYNIMDYDNLNTGDILLLSCTKWYYPFSKLIEIITNSPYSHCGIIIKDPMFTVKPMLGLYFLESGFEKFNDVENNRRKCGVELVSLKEMIDNYPGTIYYRKLKCNRNQDFYDKLAFAHSDIHNLPYDFNPIDWFKAIFNINIGNNQLDDRLWCSALVAYIYVKFGFLDKNTPWSLVSPKEFSSVYGNNILKFKNCLLEDDIKIK